MTVLRSDERQARPRLPWTAARARSTSSLFRRNHRAPGRAFRNRPNRSRSRAYGRLLVEYSYENNESGMGRTRRSPGQSGSDPPGRPTRTARGAPARSRLPPRRRFHGTRLNKTASPDSAKPRGSQPTASQPEYPDHSSSCPLGKFHDRPPERPLLFCLRQFSTALGTPWNDGFWRLPCRQPPRHEADRSPTRPPRRSPGGGEVIPKP